MFSFSWCLSPQELLEGVLLLQPPVLWGKTGGVTPGVSLLSSSYRAGNGWWWVPVVAPMVGATLGTATYQLLIALHHPEDSEEAAQDLALAQYKDLDTPASTQMPQQSYLPHGQ